MKRFVLKILCFAICLAAILLVLCILIDPFSVFHPMNVKDNGVEPNKNYIKTYYILQNPNRFDSFMFGASNVGNIHTDKMPGNCYNMTYSAGYPDEYLATLRTFIENGVIPKKIYVGLGSLAYSGMGKYHLDDPLRSPYWYSKTEPFKFWKLYLSPSTVGNAVLEVMAEHNYESKSIEVFYDYGWNYDYGYETTCDFGDDTPDQMMAKLYGTVDEESERLPFELMLDKVEDIISLCESNGIEVEFFTVPFYYGEQLTQTYIECFKALAKITPFWNFSGYNDLVFDSANYVDTAHYNAEVGDMIINCMCYGEKYEGLYEQGFGVYVTENNADEVIDRIKGE